MASAKFPRENSNKENPAFAEHSDIEDLVSAKAVALVALSCRT
ncbi:hypothetical protein [Desulfitobacterium sp.]|nr:hypothetical protein [Desulfitobacterium sp.]HVJ47894.1 hypothetical protein [Desulfitobacterium sp.]